MFLHDHGFGHILDMTPKAEVVKAKLDKWTTLNFKNLTH